jgi:hypothetical protein
MPESPEVYDKLKGIEYLMHFLLSLRTLQKNSSEI